MHVIHLFAMKMTYESPFTSHNRPIVSGSQLLADTLRQLMSVCLAPRYRANIKFMQLSNMSLADVATVELLCAHRLGERPNNRGEIDSQCKRFINPVVGFSSTVPSHQTFQVVIAGGKTTR
jgi:hypothetical protein